MERKERENKLRRRVYVACAVVILFCSVLAGFLTILPRGASAAVEVIPGEYVVGVSGPSGAHVRDITEFANVSGNNVSSLKNQSGGAWDAAQGKAALAFMADGERDVWEYKITSVAGMNAVAALSNAGVAFNERGVGASGNRIVLYMMNDIDYSGIPVPARGAVYPAVRTNYQSIGRVTSGNWIAAQAGGANPAFYARAAATPFSGVFNGMGRKIYGLSGWIGTQNTTAWNTTTDEYSVDTGYLALFGVVRGGIIANFSLKKPTNYSPTATQINMMMAYNDACAVNRADNGTILYGIVNELNWSYRSGTSTYTSTGGVVGVVFDAAIVSCVNQGSLVGSGDFISAGTGYARTSNAAGGENGGIMGEQRSDNVAILNTVNAGDILWGWSSNGGFFSGSSYQRVTMSNVAGYGRVFTSNTNYNTAIVGHLDFHTDGSAANSLWNNVYGYNDNAAASTNRFNIHMLRIPNTGANAAAGLGTGDKFAGDADQTSASSFASRIAYLKKLGAFAGDYLELESDQVKYGGMTGVNYVKSAEFAAKMNANANALREDYPKYAPYITDWKIKQNVTSRGLAAAVPMTSGDNAINFTAGENVIRIGEKYYYGANSYAEVSVGSLNHALSVRYSVNGAAEIAVGSSVFTLKVSSDASVVVRAYDGTALVSQTTLVFIEAKEKLLISSADDLERFAVSVNLGMSYSGKVVKLNGNLTLSGENNFVVIGDARASAFRGTFDGQNYTLAGIHSNRNTDTGLFGYINGGTVRNLTISGDMPNRGSGAAALSGHIYAGKLINITNNVTVSGVSYVSAFGQSDGANESPSYIISCVNNAAITGAGGYVGGFLSSSQFTNVYNCINNGAATGQIANSPLAGFIALVQSNTTVENSVNFGGLSGTAATGTQAAAFIGYNSGTQSYVKNSFYYSGGGSRVYGVGAVTVTDTVSIAANGVTAAHVKPMNERVLTYRKNPAAGTSSEDYRWWQQGTGGTPYDSSETNKTTRIAFGYRLITHGGGVAYPATFPKAGYYYTNAERPLDYPNGAPEATVTPYVQSAGDPLGAVYLDNAGKYWYSELAQVGISVAAGATRQQYMFYSFEYARNQAAFSPDNNIPIYDADSNLGEQTYRFRTRNLYGEESAVLELKFERDTTAPGASTLDQGYRKVAYWTDGAGTLRVQDGHPQAGDDKIYYIPYSYGDYAGYAGVSKSPYAGASGVTYYHRDVIVFVGEGKAAAQNKSGVLKYQYSLNNGFTWTDVRDFFGADTLAGGGVPYVYFSATGDYNVIFRAVSNTGTNGTPSDPLRIVIDKTIPETPVVSRDYRGDWADGYATLTFMAQSANIGADGFHFEYRLKMSAIDNSPYSALAVPDGDLSKYVGELRLISGNITAEEFGAPNYTATDGSGGYLGTSETLLALNAVEGTVIVQVRAVSRSGNRSAVVSSDIRIDLNAPTIEDFKSNSPDTPSSDLVLTVTASDGFGIGGLKIGWVKFNWSANSDYPTLQSKIDSLTPNWNDQTRYIVDENNAYYAVFVRDAMSKMSTACLFITNLIATRPSSPSIKYQALLERDGDALKPFLGSAAQYEANPDKITGDAQENSRFKWVDYSMNEASDWFKIWGAYDWTNALVRLMIFHGSSYIFGPEIDYTQYRINSEDIVRISASEYPVYYSEYLDRHSGMVRVYGATVDKEGNSSSLEAGGFSFITQVNIDRVAPAAPLFSVSYHSRKSLETYYASEYVVITLAVSEEIGYLSGMASGVKRLQYSFDGVDWQEYSREFAVRQSGEVYFRQGDYAGNIGEVASITVIIDGVAPSAPDVETSMPNRFIRDGTEIKAGDTPLSADGAYYTTGPVTITITPRDEGGSGIASVGYSFDAHEWKGLGWGSSANDYVTFSIAEAGTYYIYLRVTDNAGNIYVSETPDATVVVITSVAPVLAVPEGGYNPDWVSSPTKSVNVEFGMADDSPRAVRVIGYYMSQNSAAPSLSSAWVALTADADENTGKITQRFDLAPGTYYFWAISNLGTIGARLRVVVDKCDTVNPVLTGASAAAAWFNSDKPITVTVDPGYALAADLLYYLTTDLSTPVAGLNITAEACVTAENLRASAVGRYRVIALAPSGRLSNGVTVDIENIDKTRPVIADVTVNDNFSASFSVTDAGGAGILRYGLTVTDQYNEGMMFIIAAGADGRQPSSGTFTVWGNGTVYLWAIDAAGNVSASRQIQMHGTSDDLKTVISSVTPAAGSAPAGQWVRERTFIATVGDADGIRAYALTPSASAPDLSDPNAWRYSYFDGTNIVALNGVQEQITLYFTIDGDVTNASAYYYLWILDVANRVAGYGLTAYTTGDVNARFVPGLIDVTPPVLPAAGDGYAITFGGSDGGKYIVLTVSGVSDAGSNGITYSLDGNVWQTSNAFAFDGTLIPKAVTGQTVSVFVRDAVGNVASVTGVPLTGADSAAPEISVTVNSAGTWTTNNKIVSVSIADAAAYAYNIDQWLDAWGAFNSAAPPRPGWANLGNNAGAFSAGRYTIRALDIFGNYSWAYFTVDRVDAFDVTFTAAADNLTAAMLRITLTITVTNSGEGANPNYSYSLDGGASWTPFTGISRVVVLTVNGDYAVKVRNEVRSSETQTVAVHNVQLLSPAVNAPTTDNETWTNVNKRVPFTVSAPVSAGYTGSRPISYYISASQNSPAGTETSGTGAAGQFPGFDRWSVPFLTRADDLYEFTFAVSGLSLPMGSYYIWAKDGAGNISAARAFTVANIDTIPPETQFHSISYDGGGVKATLLLIDSGNSGVAAYYAKKFTGRQNLSSVGTSFTAADRTAYTAAVLVLNLTAGDGWWYVFSEDAAGNRSNVVEFLQTARMLSSMEITRLPRTSYTALDRFDPSGMTVRATYNDGLIDTAYTLYTDLSATIMRFGTTSLRITSAENPSVYAEFAVTVVKKVTATNPVYVGGTLYDDVSPSAVVLRDSNASVNALGVYGLLTTALKSGKNFYEYKFTPYDGENYADVYGRIELNVEATEGGENPPPSAPGGAEGGGASSVVTVMLVVSIIGNAGAGAFFAVRHSRRKRMLA